MALLQELRALEAITELSRGRRVLVLYSEGKEYWPHYRGIVRELIHSHHCPFVYIASTSDDPGLKITHPLVSVFNIGRAGARVNLFKDICADIMVLTMPDLGNLTLARSPNCGQYVYLFHSPVSTHMVYREGAFDGYDTIFCVGPHHEAEIRKREQMIGLPAKRLFHCGYSRLDEIIAEVAARDEASEPRVRAQVLLAPSWGPAGILETIGGDVVQTLLDGGYRVVVRPHPQTVRLSKPAIEALATRFGAQENFALETDMGSKASFYESDVVISDWSGAALDFAFSRLRPVVFLDTPRKVNNPNWRALANEPLEADLRDRIGVVVPPHDARTLTAAVASLLGNAPEFRKRILEERGKWIFNVGESSRIAARELAKMAFDASLGDEGEPEDIERRCVDMALGFLSAAEETGAPPSSGGQSLPAFLQQVLAADGSVAAEQVRQLDTLCRRVDVFKRVHRDYETGFVEPLAQSPAADAPTLASLAVALISTARGFGDANKGDALKFLNAAGNVLNAYEASGDATGLIAFESFLARATDDVIGRVP